MWPVAAPNLPEPIVRSLNLRVPRLRPSALHWPWVLLSSALASCSDGSTGTERVPVSSVAIIAPADTVIAGRSLQLTADARDASGGVLAGRAIEWSSDNPGAATVSASGMVVGVSPGTAGVTAASEGRSARSTIRVLPVPVAAITVSPATATLSAGSTQQLVAVLRDGSGAVISNRALAWSSSDTTMARVSGTGLVAALARGTVSITVTSEGRTASAILSILPASVASVTLSLDTATMVVGTTRQLAVTVRDALGKTVTDSTVSWSSSDLTRARVSSSGLVYAASPGVVQIIASIQGRSDTARVTAVASTAALSCSPVALSLGVASTTTITCALQAADSLAGTVSISVERLPTGISAEPFVRTMTVPPTGTVTFAVAVNVAAGAPQGASDFDIVASSGSVRRIHLQRVATGPRRPRVRMIYLVPSDQTADTLVMRGMERAIRHLQIFYANALGSGKTFTISYPVVEVFRTTQPSSWYSTGSMWEKATADVFAMGGGRFYDTQNIWTIYLNVDGGPVGGTASVALLPRGDVQGICGRDPGFGVCRWVGGLGHEVGHAFGLPHPPGCGTGGPGCVTNALMWLGYASYPDATLTPENRQFLNTSGFFSAQDVTSNLFACSELTSYSAQKMSSATEGRPVLDGRLLMRELESPRIPQARP